MAGFSIFLISQEKNIENLEFQRFAFQVNHAVDDVLQDHIDNNNQIKDIGSVKKEFVRNSNFFGYLGTEVAIFSNNYNLIFSTNDNWMCSYTEHSEGNKAYTGYGYLNPKDWFSEKETAALKNYLYANPKAEKIGDLSGYSIDLEGFWLDNEMIIPDKIRVTPMFAKSFDENGNVASSGGTQTDDIIYVSGYKNTKNLPYFKDGSIVPVNREYSDSQKQINLRSIVRSKEKLKEAVKQSQVGQVSYQRVSLLTYRYYLPLSYKNTVQMLDNNNCYSEFWTVFAREVNLLDRCANTLVFVYISSFIIFSIAAFILSAQSYKTYEKREKLEKHRKDMTNALAHDLKTPLTIVSGYVQNLIENIHTEKRDYYAVNIQANVERMDKIIQEMLELSRLESSSLEIKFEDVHIGEVCRKVTHRYKQVCNEKSIEIHIEGDSIIKANTALIEKVIDNFFVNALENTPLDGIISINMSGDTFEFYNSGDHIPEEKIHEIWQPYKKADTSRSNTKGTGLGLAICRTILELFKFQYGVKNVNGGVIFWFKYF